MEAMEYFRGSTEKSALLRAGKVIILHQQNVMKWI
jgi:hypothetical protein